MEYQHEKEDNVVRISAGKKINEYVWPMLTRFQSDPYDRFGYLKLRFTRNLKREVFQLVSLFSTFRDVDWDKITKLEDPLKVGKSNYLDNVHELFLIKNSNPESQVSINLDQEGLTIRKETKEQKLERLKEELAKI